MLRLLSLPIAFLVVVQLSGCKKGSENEMFEFSFSYNGHPYTNPDYGFVTTDGQGGVSGIEIRKPDVFGGLIRFYWTTNCGFLEPTGMTDYSNSNQVSFNYNTCAYQTFGVIDSSKIFWYSSGSGNYTLTNCKHRKFLNDEWDECTAIGSFSLVLVNKAGDTKSITGTFKDPGIIQ